MELPPNEGATDDTLAAALARHSIILPPEQVAALDRYCALLWEWNEKINLTRHADYERFVSRDVVDAQRLAGQLAPRERVLDVGSGGGAPGVLLAILRPDLKVSLSESVGKKARALEDIVKRLPLPAAVHHCRAEDVLGAKRFDALTVRAVAPLSKLLTWFKPHWGAFERLLVIKGPAWVEERKDAREAGLMRGFQLRKRDAWPLPGTHSESVLLEIRPETVE